MIVRLIVEEGVVWRETITNNCCQDILSNSDGRSRNEINNVCYHYGCGKFGTYKLVPDMPD